MKTVKAVKDGETIPDRAKYLTSRMDEESGKLVHIYEIELIEVSDNGKGTIIPEWGKSKKATGLTKVINQDMVK
ncbi:MAG: hypothetical protein ACM34K_18330 [Bacillota bacterium]